MMAPLNNDYQPPARRLYYVIGRCDALRAPAIFLDWDDCSFYVDQNENDRQVEMQSFDRITDAVNYLTDQLTRRNQTKSAAVTAGNQPPPQHASAAVGNNSSRAATTTPLPTRASLHNTSKRAAENNTSLASSSQSAKQPRTEPAAALVSTKKSPFETNSASKKSPFEKKFDKLIAYQQLYGTLEVKGKHCQTETFKGLQDFMLYWKTKQRTLEEYPDRISPVAQMRIQHLMNLGVKFPTDERKWSDRFDELRAYQEIYGKLNISHGHPLRPWSVGQREHMRRYEEDPNTSKLVKEQYQQLVDLGMKAAVSKATGKAVATGETTALASTSPAPASPTPASPARKTTGSSWEEMLENTS
jgi:hypothetical protein